MNHAEAYERVYRRVLPLLNANTAGAEVPTCPGWTVKDVVAHLAGLFTAYRSGDPKEAFSPDWGDREVNARRDHSLDEDIAEWGRLLKDPGDLFESHLAPVAVSDVLAHEQDIRTALQEPGARDDENIVPAVEMGLAFVEKKAEAAGLPALKVITGEIDRQVGEGDPVATLRTSSYELFRALHGRRTIEQVRAMEWDGDPGPWMSVFFLFGPPTERAVEE
ncbi:MAG: hypothetical protein QOH26_153 [Actinomycetota bacterium]|nr:hypothetical protein [Actinomycetota bacterium]